MTVTFGRIVIVSGRSAGKLGQMSVALSQKLQEPAWVGVPSIRQFEESTSLSALPTSARPGREAAGVDRDVLPLAPGVEVDLVEVPLPDDSLRRHQRVIGEAEPGCDEQDGGKRDDQTDVTAKTHQTPLAFGDTTQLHDAAG